MTAHEIAEDLGIGRDSVLRSIKAQGLSFKRGATFKGGSKLDPYLSEIKALYEGGATLTEIIQKYDCDWMTLRKFAKVHGFAIRTTWSRNPSGKNLQTLPPEKISEMVRLYTTENKTLKDLAAVFGICKVSVRKLLKQAGVKMREAHTRKKTSEEKLNTVLNRTYGISHAEYEALLVKQDGVCTICGCQHTDQARNRGRQRFCVDHDHQTGQVRGLLCAICNYGIGHFRDDPALLRKAAAYIESHAQTLASAPVPEKLTSTPEGTPHASSPACFAADP